MLRLLIGTATCAIAAALHTWSLFNSPREATFVWFVLSTIMLWMLRYTTTHFNSQYRQPHPTWHQLWHEEWKWEDAGGMQVFEAEYDPRWHLHISFLIAGILFAPAVIVFAIWDWFSAQALKIHSRIKANG